MAMKKVLFFGFLVISVVLTGLSAGPAAAGDEYYGGKTITVIVGLRAGGTADTFARSFSSYWEKHIPGKPKIIVKNMPGGGNMKATNYVFEKAKPDGKTVVVGGLKRINEAETFTGVPWTEKIPVIRELTSLTTKQETTTSFFLFIRPKILRDSRFRDLRYLSDIDTQDANLSADYPESHPILIPCPTSLTPRPIPRSSNMQH